MKEKIKILEQILGEVRVKKDEPLKYHLASNVLGKAEVFYIATNLKELEQVLNLCYELDIPFSLIGNGTKMEVPDGGLKGFVIKNRASSIKISGVKGKVSSKGIGVEEAMVEVESGASFQKLNDFLNEQSLQALDLNLNLNSTIGGSISTAPLLQTLIQKVKVFSEGEVFDIDIHELKENDYVLSIILKVHSAD